MSPKAIDELLNRWFLDGQFRAELRNDPEQALAHYRLTPTQRAKLFKLNKHPAPSRHNKAVIPPGNFDNPFSLN